MLLTLIVVVASQMCAHVKTLKIIYIIYEQILNINYFSQTVLKIYAKATSTHPTNSQTIHTHTNTNSTTYTEKK